MKVRVPTRHAKLIRALFAQWVSENPDRKLWVYWVGINMTLVMDYEHPELYFNDHSDMMINA